MQTWNQGNKFSPRCLAGVCAKLLQPVLGSRTWVTCGPALAWTYRKSPASTENFHSWNPACCSPITVPRPVSSPVSFYQSFWSQGDLRIYSVAEMSLQQEHQEPKCPCPFCWCEFRGGGLDFTQEWSWQIWHSSQLKVRCTLMWTWCFRTGHRALQNLGSPGGLETTSSSGYSVADTGSLSWGVGMSTYLPLMSLSLLWYPPNPLWCPSPLWCPLIPLLMSLSPLLSTSPVMLWVTHSLCDQYPLFSQTWSRGLN